MLRETRVSLAKSRGLRYVQMMRNSSRGMSNRETMMNVDAGGLAVGRWKNEMAVETRESTRVLGWAEEVWSSHCTSSSQVWGLVGGRANDCRCRSGLPFVKSAVLQAADVSMTFLSYLSISL